MKANLDPKNRAKHLKASRTGTVKRTVGGFMETYLIVIGKTATGYSAHCPDVLGCAAVGKTVEEVAANMKKALEMHFEGMVEDGEPIPQPRGVDSYREVRKDLDLDQYFLAHVQIDTSTRASTTTS
jgi:predicted RNase H-like HicB family nuclease